MATKRLSKQFRPAERNRIQIDGTLEKVSAIRFTVLEAGKNATPYAYQGAVRESVRERVPCHNPDCFDGGISFGDLLRELVANHQEAFIGTSFCTGRVGDPELIKNRPSCTTRFEIEISLQF